MRDLHPDLVALLAARRGLRAELLLWIVARDRATGAPVAGGFTSNVESVTLTVEGASRTYVAAGGLLRIEPVVAETGVGVRMLSARLSGVAPEVDAVLRGYDPRLAAVEVHRRVLDPETGVAAGPPLRLFRGAVDEAPVRTPEKGGTVSIELRLAPAARDLTRTVPLKKSDESQKRRGGDRFRRWGDVAGEVDVWWGAVRHTPAAAPVQPAVSGGERRSGSDR